MLSEHDGGKEMFSSIEGKSRHSAAFHIRCALPFSFPDLPFPLDKRGKLMYNKAKRAARRAAAHRTESNRLKGSIAS